MREVFFISYRRTDTADIANELHEALSAWFGPDNVFLDKDRLEFGSSWSDQVRSALERTTILVALIGDGWLARGPNQSRSRLFDRKDVVRREVVFGLHSPDITVIPLWCGEAIPSSDLLPLSIRRLMRLQGARIDPTDVPGSVEALVRKLQRFKTNRVILQGPRPEDSPSTNKAALVRLATEIARSRADRERMWRLKKRISSIAFGKEEEFLIEDPRIVSAMYDEPIIYPGLPYAEVVNWCRQLAQGYIPRIDIERARNDFRLTGWVDDELNQSREEALAIYRRGHKNTYPGPAVRVRSFWQTPTVLGLSTQPANFFDQIKSNRSVDKPVAVRGVETSARKELIGEFGGKLPPLSDGRLANTLGIATLIFWKSDRGWVPYFTTRSGNVSFMKNAVHCTASGVAEYGLAGRLRRFHFDSAYRELKEEVGLDPWDLTGLAPIAFCRELIRCGKPQLFFIGTTELPRRQIREKLSSAQEHNRRKKRTDHTAHVENVGAPILDWYESMLSGDGAEPEFSELKVTAEAAALLYYFFEMQRQRSLPSKVYARVRGLFG